MAICQFSFEGFKTKNVSSDTFLEQSSLLWVLSSTPKRHKSQRGRLSLGAAG